MCAPPWGSIAGGWALRCTADAAAATAAQLSSHHAAVPLGPVNWATAVGMVRAMTSGAASHLAQSSSPPASSPSRGRPSARVFILKRKAR